MFSRRDPRAQRHERHRQRGRRQRHHDAFREELAHDASAPGSQRHPQRQLALPLGAARQDQVGDVHAGDQHHQHRRRLPDHQDLRQHRVAEAEVEGHHLDAAARVRLRVLRLEPPGDDGERRLRLVDGAPVRQAAQDLR